MVRHKKFENLDELRSFLATAVPSDVYYSSALYEHPEIEMDRKGWLGADLIFDIDADHIPTACNKVHDTWVCSKCGFVGRGITPKICPRCGESKFTAKAWPCEVCLETAKVETIKLLDMLIKDLGFSSSEIVIAFSGHRGYHVHVESKATQDLGQMARKEIVDYVIGLGIEPAFHGLNEKGSKSYGAKGPSLDDLGWTRRIAKGTYEILLKATPEALECVGLHAKVIDILIKNRNALLKSWNIQGPRNAVKGIGAESWKRIVARSIEFQAAKIDTVVTTDIHRLIRLTNTLHGKTALKKMECLFSNVDNFDPLKSSVVFRQGTITVDVIEAPKFRVGDEVFGPYKNRRIELPTAAALFLLCKNAAEVVN